MKRKEDIRKYVERLFDIIVGKTKATDLERVKAFESLMTKKPVPFRENIRKHG